MPKTRGKWKRADQARLTRWVRWWVANLFAFAALSRVMGWNMCKFFHTLICLITRVSITNANGVCIGNLVVNFQHTNTWKTKKNVLNMPVIFFHIVTSSAVSIISIDEADPREQSEWLEKSIEVVTTFMHIYVRVTFFLKKWSTSAA